LIPKIIKRTGINLSIENKAIKKYIKLISPNRSGVRDLERFFSNIYEKILLIKNIQYRDDINFDKIRIIDTKLINKLLI
jgi:ATP-dependent Lon protease